MTQRRAAQIVAAVLAVIAVVWGIVALTGPSEPESATPPPAEPDVAPLTGLPVDDPASLDHPAVSLKVSNVENAHPQEGVDRADIVFVEPIGVSYTRLAAVFHSEVPNAVGPIRSARPMDVPLLSPLVPVFGHTMAAEWVMNYITDTGTGQSLGSLQVASASDAYDVSNQRPSPDDVIANPTTLLATSTLTDAPAPYFSYAGDGASAAQGPGLGSSITIPYGPDWDVTWVYDAATASYLRSEPFGAHTMADGTQISATNVLILGAESVEQKLAEGSGAPVPVLQLIDTSGPLTAVAGGASVTGTWSKAGVDDPFELRTDSGEPLLLAPGKTWVEFPAPDAATNVG